MIATIIAVLGTLAGTALANALQARSTRTALANNEAASRRQDAVNALADLTAAVAAHRSAMWHRETLRLTGADWTQARTTSHSTRTAISAPAVRIAVLAPQLRTAADAAVHATYALRDAETTEALAASREASLAADERLLAEAGRLLGI